MGGGGNLPVGPGIWGFIAFFVLAISLWLLVRNMNSRLRRMAYRDRDEAAEAQREAAADSDRVGGTEPGTGAGADPRTEPGAGTDGTDEDDTPPRAH